MATEKCKKCGNKYSTEEDGRGKDMDNGLCVKCDKLDMMATEKERKEKILEKLNRMHPAQKAVLKMAKETLSIEAENWDGDVDSIIDIWWDSFQMSEEELKNSEVIEFTCNSMKRDLFEKSERKKIEKDLNLKKVLESKDGKYDICSPDGDPNRGSYFIEKKPHPVTGNVTPKEAEKLLFQQAKNQK